MTDEVEQEKKMNPIAVAITTFLHALRDAEGFQGDGGLGVSSSITSLRLLIASFLDS